MQLRFYKEDNRWYLDSVKYIEQGGTKAELEMVSGADRLLQLLSSYSVNVPKHPYDIWAELGYVQEVRYASDVVLDIQTVPFVGANTLMKLPEEGWYTQLNDGHLLWLCPVTLFIFDGVYPDFIYYKKISP